MNQAQSVRLKLESIIKDYDAKPNLFFTITERTDNTNDRKITTTLFTKEGGMELGSFVLWSTNCDPKRISTYISIAETNFWGTNESGLVCSKNINITFKVLNIIKTLNESTELKKLFSEHLENLSKT